MDIHLIYLNSTYANFVPELKPYNWLEEPSRMERCFAPFLIIKFMTFKKIWYLCT